MSETKPYQFKVGDEGEMLFSAYREGCRYQVLALTTIKGEDYVVVKGTLTKTGEEFISAAYQGELIPPKKVAKFFLNVWKTQYGNYALGAFSSEEDAKKNGRYSAPPGHFIAVAMPLEVEDKGPVSL